MTWLESILQAVGRGAMASILALPFEVRLLAVCLIGFLTLVRASRPVPLNSAFTRREAARRTPEKTDAADPKPVAAPEPRRLRVALKR